MSSAHGLLFCTAAFVAFSMHPAPSLAQTPAAPRAAEMQRLFDCSSLTDGVPRLACYDAAVASLNQAEQQGGIVVVERERLLEARRALFGFSLPSLPSVLGDVGQLDEVETTLERASYNPSAGWTFHLADGSVWRQIDSTALHFQPNAGLRIRLRRGAMGSYFLKVADNPAVRAKRQ